jgi:hypothetical protein
MVNNNLVGGYHQPLNEKSESQMGLLFPIYGRLIIQMFQTTNQIILMWDTTG